MCGKLVVGVKTVSRLWQGRALAVKVIWLLSEWSKCWTSIMSGRIDVMNYWSHHRWLIWTDCVWVFHCMAPHSATVPGAISLVLQTVNYCRRVKHLSPLSVWWVCRLRTSVLCMYVYIYFRHKTHSTTHKQTHKKNRTNSNYQQKQRNIDIEQRY